MQPLKPHRRTRLICLSLSLASVAALITASPASAAAGPAGSGAFKHTGDLQGVSWAGSIKIADVSGDARNDVVALADTPAGARIAVWNQQANGSLVAAPALYPVVAGAFGLALGDLDGDGDVDAAVATDTAVHIYLRSGATMTDSATYTSTREIDGVDVGDLNDDARDDLLMLETDFIDDFAVRRLQSANGSSFGNEVSLGTVVGESFTIADIDDDGDLDFVNEGYTNPKQIFRQGADHNFSVTPLDLGDSTQRVLFDDLTGDGVEDAVGVGSNGSVVVRPGTGGGAFGPAQSSQASANGFMAGSGDVDGNGGGDVVLVGSGSLQALLQRPDHSLVPGCTFTTPQGFESAVGDVNGDGRPDVVLGQGVLDVYTALGSGEHLDAELTAGAQPGSLTGQLQLEELSCRPSEVVEIWGSPPSGGSPQKLQEVALSTFTPASPSTYASSYAFDETGTWSMFARWDGGDVYGLVQSPTVQVVVPKRETWIELEGTPTKTTTGDPLTLTASVGDIGVDAPTGVVEFYGTVDGHKTTLGQVAIGPDQTASLEVAPTFITKYAAKYLGDDTYEPLAAASFVQDVQADVAAKMVRFHHREGAVAFYRATQRVYLASDVVPARSGKVSIYLWDKFKGHWRQLDSAKFKLDDNGSVTVYAPGRLFAKGRLYRFQTRYAGDRLILGGVSPYALFKTF